MATVETAAQSPFCGRAACRKRCKCVFFHVVGIHDTAHIEDRPAGPRPKGGVRGKTRCGIAFVPSVTGPISRNEKVWRKCKETCSECWQKEIESNVDS
jgi:hypothetical protein